MSSEYSEPPMDPALAARQPLAVLGEVVVEDRGERRRNPPGLERCRRIRLRTDTADVELGPGIQERLEDDLVVLPRPEELEARLTGHSVTKAFHVASRDGEVPDVEDFISGTGPPNSFSMTALAWGPCN